MNDVKKFGIDLGRYQTMFGDELDTLIEKFEHTHLYDLADRILRVESPHLFDGDNDVLEECYDDFAEQLFELVQELGKHIFGYELYAVYITGDRNINDE
tara:strand:+ start:22325 stop:22621 length:297 start_codon:yes stop_codon:yes gene_type:complete